MITNAEDFEKGFHFAECVHRALGKYVPSKELLDYLKQIASGKVSLITDAEAAISAIEQEMGESLKEDARERTRQFMANREHIEAMHRDNAKIILRQYGIK